MTEPDPVEERLRAIERALTDDAEVDLTDLADAARTAARVETAVDRLEDLEERIDELEAATQALRGYVGNVRSVNRDIERRADAALAAVERLEGRLSGDETQEDQNGDEWKRRGADVDRRSHEPDGSGTENANRRAGRRDGEPRERQDRGDRVQGNDHASGRRHNQWQERSERKDGPRGGPASGSIGTDAVEGDRDRGVLGRIRDVL